MLPVMLDVRGKSVLIAGGGRIALRKAGSFLSEGADVTVVSPEILPELLEENITYIRDIYRSGYIEGHFIAVAATDSRGTNRQVISDAKAAGILCMSVSEWESGDFISMIYERSGDVTAALSTEGKAPAFLKSERCKLIRFVEECNEDKKN